MSNRKHGARSFIWRENLRIIDILESGWLKATRMTHEGREQGLQFSRPMEIFGDNAVF